MTKIFFQLNMEGDFNEEHNFSWFYSLSLQIAYNMQRETWYLYSEKLRQYCDTLIQIDITIGQTDNCKLPDLTSWVRRNIHSVEFRPGIYKLTLNMWKIFIILLKTILKRKKDL